MFKYFDYEFYNSYLDKILWSNTKETLICNEDIKQNMFIYIIEMEDYIDRKGVENISHLENYVKFLLKNRVRNEMKKLYKDMNHVKIDIDSLESELIDEAQDENILCDKILLNDILNSVNITEKEKNILLDKDFKEYRNQKYNILKKIRRRLSNLENK